MVKNSFYYIPIIVITFLVDLLLIIAHYEYNILLFSQTIYFYSFATMQSIETLVFIKYFKYLSFNFYSFSSIWIPQDSIEATNSQFYITTKNADPLFNLSDTLLIFFILLTVHFCFRKSPKSFITRHYAFIPVPIILFFSCADLFLILKKVNQLTVLRMIWTGPVFLILSLLGCLMLSMDFKTIQKTRVQEGTRSKIVKRQG